MVRVFNAVNSGSMTLTMRANVPSAVKLAADKQLARASLFSLRYDTHTTRAHTGRWPESD